MNTAPTAGFRSQCKRIGFSGSANSLIHQFLRAIPCHITALSIAQIEDAVDDGLDSITVWNDHILVCSCPGIVEGGELAIVLITLAGTQSDMLNGGIREGA